MSVSSSEILCLGVGVKESPSFSISISCLVEIMLDKFITCGDIFSVVVDNGFDSFLNVQFHFLQVFDQQVLINCPRCHHFVLDCIYSSGNQAPFSNTSFFAIFLFCSDFEI